MAALPPPGAARLSMPSFTQNRFLTYGATSTALAASVVLNAAATRTNFYAASIHLSSSNGATLILCNFAVFLTLLFGMALQRVFFGRLRAIEVEHLYDRSWYFVTESLLALTMFRGSFDSTFIILFGLLLFLKSFHWVAADRIEWMDQVPPPGPPKSFHFRMTALFLFLVTADVLLLSLSLKLVLPPNRLNGKVLFVSEYTILTTAWINVVGKYGVNLWEKYREYSAARARAAAIAEAVEGDEEEEEEEDDRGWEGKSMVVFYIDLVTDFLKLATYFTFFIVILTNFGLPFNILRDVYLTLRSFIGRVKTLVQYTRATSRMDERYPDATREEMDAMDDRVCIICREEMVWFGRDGQDGEAEAAAGGEEAGATTGGEGGGARRRRPRRRREGDRPKKLSCNHCFHLNCLKSWLERQQNCPTCRRTVLPTAPAVPTIGGPAPPLARPGQAPLPPHQQQPNPWQPYLIPPVPGANPNALHPHPTATAIAPPSAGPTSHPLPPQAGGGFFGHPLPPPNYAYNPPHPQQQQPIHTQPTAAHEQAPSTRLPQPQLRFPLNPNQVPQQPHLHPIPHFQQPQGPHTHFHHHPHQPFHPPLPPSSTTTSTAVVILPEPRPLFLFDIRLWRFGFKIEIMGSGGRGATRDAATTAAIERAMGANGFRVVPQGGGAARAGGAGVGAAQGMPTGSAPFVPPQPTATAMPNPFGFPPLVNQNQNPTPTPTAPHPASSTSQSTSGPRSSIIAGPSDASDTPTPTQTVPSTPLPLSTPTSMPLPPPSFDMPVDDNSPPSNSTPTPSQPTPNCSTSSPNDPDRPSPILSTPDATADRSESLTIYDEDRGASMMSCPVGQTPRELAALAALKRASPRAISSSSSSGMPLPPLSSLEPPSTIDASVGAVRTRTTNPDLSPPLTPSSSLTPSALTTASPSSSSHLAPPIASSPQTPPTSTRIFTPQPTLTPLLPEAYYASLPQDLPPPHPQSSSTHSSDGALTAPDGVEEKRVDKGKGREVDPREVALPDAEDEF